MKFLKKQVQTDQEAFDIVAKAEIDCETSILGHKPTKSSKTDLCNLMKKSVKLLPQKGEFLQNKESVSSCMSIIQWFRTLGKVSQFSHKFLEEQHASEILIS